MLVDTNTSVQSIEDAPGERSLQLMIEGHAELAQSELTVKNVYGSISMPLADFKALAGLVERYERLVAEAQKEEAA